VSAVAGDESDFFERFAQEFSHMGLAIDDTHTRRHFSLAERRQLQGFFWLLFGHGTPYDLTRRYDSFFDHPESEAFPRKTLRS
jgi:hypothetical protein